MTFYAVSTRNAFEVTPHATYEAAAEYLVASLNGDYADDFWIECGRLCSNYNSRCDFTLSIYESPEDCVSSMRHLDDDVKVAAFRALADAMQAALEVEA